MPYIETWGCITKEAVLRRSTQSEQSLLIYFLIGGTVVEKLAEPCTGSERLASAIRDLQSLQQVLMSGDLDERVLCDFRDAVNRIRNTAWAAQQIVASQMSEQGPAGITTLLASERIRSAYQLCRAIEADLKGDEIQFQKGQLAELHTALTQLAQQLKERLESK